MTAVDATATIGGSVGRKLLGGFDGAHTLQQIGLKTLRTPTATLTLAKASLKAIAVAPEPARRWAKPGSIGVFRSVCQGRPACASRCLLDRRKARVRVFDTKESIR
jgi:hypothetical protein